MNCKETDIMPKAFFANKSERFKAVNGLSWIAFL